MSSVERWRVRVQGVVQGVGFRPFVYGLATRLELAGFVSNNSGGVHIEVEGPRDTLERFRTELESEAPPLAHIDSVVVETMPVVGEAALAVPQKARVAESRSRFTIHVSEAIAGAITSVSPDVATCVDCLRELFDPHDRRYRYPFINCTNCGPRYTIIRDIPYDRPFTTMASFPMCSACDAEYHDPANRRFHAQPNACPVCGPQVWVQGNAESDVVLGRDGGSLREAVLERREAALGAACAALADGRIVAVKGIGGFHLACDASNTRAVEELRRRKERGDKPFGLMACDLDQVRAFAEASEEEATLLQSNERPIVLLRRKAESPLSERVAPGTALVGFMLPYSPLHALILNDPALAERPLVMTSGNLSDEPIARTNEEAMARLSKMADLFLLHDRDIHVVCDDSVVRVHGAHELPMRRSRGYAPLPVRLPREVETVLAVGAELKSTFCLTKGNHAYLSPHIGDMENLETLKAMERGLAHFRAIFRCEPTKVMCDLHPGYLSTKWAKAFAEKNGLPLLQVQHHYAHVASLMAEHGFGWARFDQSEPGRAERDQSDHDGSEQDRSEHDTSTSILGVSFDGTGYGTDGAIWGGEVMVADYRSFQRVARLKYVPLPGGDAAVKRPYRMALAHLMAAGIAWDEDLPCVAAAPADERRVLRRQIETGLNCVDTSSMGRLFDAVASLVGVCHVASYEAQAAIELEMASGAAGGDGYRFEVVESEAPAMGIASSRSGATVEGVAGSIHRTTTYRELLIDPTPALRALVADVRARIPVAVMAARFHLGVAEMIAEVCSRLRSTGAPSLVGLTGGVFQNVRLLGEAKARLERDGFRVLTHRVVPPNDGGLALGQAVVGAAALSS
jgi:hydrogenase maturation protein HypF